MTLPRAPQPSGPISYLALRRPCVMLVRIERCEEQAELDLDTLPMQVFRVRHPMPACARMRVLRPEIVLVGSSVQSWDMAHVLYEAQGIRAAVMPRSHLLAGDKLRDWILYTVDLVQQRRREADCALAS